MPLTFNDGSVRASVVHLSEHGPSERWLKLAALTWDKAFLVMSRSNRSVDDISAEFSLTSKLDFIEVIDDDSLMQDTQLWLDYAKWVDSLPPPEEFFDAMGWPKGGTTSDVVPTPERKVAIAVAQILGSKGYLRARGPWLGRREGGYYFEEVDPEWIRTQSKEGWPDQQQPFEERKKLVAASFLLSHLAWLLSLRTIGDQRADFYAHIAPEIFDHALFDHEPRSESLRSSYRVTLPTLVLPADLQTIPFPRLLELRSELAAPRLLFRKEIEGMLKDYTSAADTQSIRRLERVLLDMATERFEDARKTIVAAKHKTTLKAIGVTLAPPAIASCMASMLNIGLFEPAAVVAAVAFGAAEVLALREAAQVESRKSPWAYLTALERGRGGKWGLRQDRRSVSLFEDEPFPERFTRVPAEFQR